MYPGDWRGIQLVVLIFSYRCQVRWRFRKKIILLGGFGVGDQLPYLCVGLGGSMRRMGRTYIFPSRSSPQDSLRPQSFSCICAVSCQSHAWPLDRTLVEWIWGPLLLWFFSLGPRWISMFSCHVGCRTIQCSCWDAFDDPLSLVRATLRYASVPPLRCFVLTKDARYGIDPDELLGRKDMNFQPGDIMFSLAITI